MNEKITNKIHFPNGLGLLTVLGLTFGAINPLAWSSLRVLSINAIPILFLLLAIGGVAFIFHKKFMIFISFTACIGLSMYLKKAQNTNFEYAKHTNDLEINIANFVLLDESSIAKFKENISFLKADLVSIQVPVRLMDEKWLMDDAKENFPYRQKTSCGDTLAMVFFSARPILSLDTLCFENTISIAGAIDIEGIAKPVAFISTHIPNQDKQTQEQLTLLSNYIQENYTGQPLVALGDSEVKPWMPEMRQFKAVNSLQDSRMDMDWNHSTKYIFYSQDLVCTHFSDVLDGNGVLATYQINRANFSTAL